MKPYLSVIPGRSAAKGKGIHDQTASLQNASPLSPPPLWWRAREGGTTPSVRSVHPVDPWLPPSPTLPHKGGEGLLRRARAAFIVETSQ